MLVSVSKTKYTQGTIGWSIDQEHREVFADVIFGNVDVSLREALDKGWQNGGKRWQTGGKRWQTGGKLLTFLRFLCSIRLTLVEPRGNKYCCGEQKGSFVLWIRCIFVQRTGYSQRTKFLKQVLAIRGQVFIKAEKRTITWSLGVVRWVQSTHWWLVLGCPPF